MKKLIDYKEEIHKCSKCGLCQSVCPVYKVTGNDCSVSRGKFIMLGGIIKGDLELNKNVNKYLDMCLKCNACKDFCPSDIDARKIFLTAKAEYFNKAPNSRFIRTLHSAPVFNLFLNYAKMATSTYKFLRFDKLVRAFYPILQKFELGKKAILFNEFISNKERGKRKEEREGANSKQQIANSNLSLRGASEASDAAIQKESYFPKKTTIIYFEGCVNNYINPKTKIATENILNQMGVNVVNAKFQCCGVPFLSGGNIEQFVKQAEFNLAQIPDDFDYFLTDCASCQNAFFEYENYIKDGKLLEKLKKINEKSINVVDFVVKNTKSFEFDVEAHSKQNLNRQSRVGSCSTPSPPEGEGLGWGDSKFAHQQQAGAAAPTDEKPENLKYVALGALTLGAIVGLGYFSMKNLRMGKKYLEQYIDVTKEKISEIVSKSNPNSKETDKINLKNMLHAIDANPKYIQDELTKLNWSKTEKENFIDEISFQTKKSTAQAERALGGDGTPKPAFYSHVNDYRAFLYNWLLDTSNPLFRNLFLGITGITALGYGGKSLGEAIKDVQVKKINAQTELELQQRLVATELRNFKAKKDAAINPLCEEFYVQLQNGKPKEELKVIAENILFEVKNGPPFVYS